MSLLNSLFHQAVAGVESRLDSILTETPTQLNPKPRTDSLVDTAEQALQRSLSARGRLEARLAQAVSALSLNQQPGVATGDQDNDSVLESHNLARNSNASEKAYPDFGANGNAGKDENDYELSPPPQASPQHTASSQTAAVVPPRSHAITALSASIDVQPGTLIRSSNAAHEELLDLLLRTEESLEMHRQLHSRVEQLQSRTVELYTIFQDGASCLDIHSPLASSARSNDVENQVERNLEEAVALVTSLLEAVTVLEAKIYVHDDALRNLQANLRRDGWPGHDLDSAYIQSITQKAFVTSSTALVASFPPSIAPGPSPESSTGMTQEVRKTPSGETDVSTAEKMPEARPGSRENIENSETLLDPDDHLIRQVETLKAQYAAACKNWEGMQASLTARVLRLEEENDDIKSREHEMRQNTQDTVTQYHADLQNLRSAVALKEHELLQKQSEIDELKVANLHHARNSVTVLSEQTTTDQMSANANNHASPFSTSDQDAEQYDISRRPIESWPPFSRQLESADSDSKEEFPDAATGFYKRTRNRLGREDSTTSDVPTVSAASVLTLNELAFRDVSLDSPVVGPSLQLIDRMSSTIRRLEADKVAEREELAKVCSQRDEAREQIGYLLKEVETLSSANQRVIQLESQIKDISSKYQTALEMLGEKTEMEQELKADISDLKSMYKELVEQTLRAR